MNPYLRAAIFTVGLASVITVGVVIKDNVYPDTSTCTPQLISCPAIIGSNAMATYAAMGIPLDAGTDPYLAIQARGFTCADGGFVGPQLPQDLSIMDPSLCVNVGTGCTDPLLCVAAADGGFDPVKQVAEGCACVASDGGTCTVPDGDGGWAGAPVGITLRQPFSGMGCVPKACVEVAGKTSWPPECPSL